MSIFEKLGFKKKPETPRGDIPPMGKTPIEGEAMGDMPPMRKHALPRFETAPASPEPARPSFDMPKRESSDLVNAKLDAIKAILDNINNRIEHLEKIAQGEQTPRWK